MGIMINRRSENTSIDRFDIFHAQIWFFANNERSEYCYIGLAIFFQEKVLTFVHI